MTIDENKILAEVEQTSAYIASSDTEHPENFTTIAATESDRPLLRRFYRESLAELPFIKAAGRLAATIFTSACGFLVDRILQRWFGIVCPDRAAAYRESADERLAHLRRLLASRVHRRQEPL